MFFKGDPYPTIIHMIGYCIRGYVIHDLITIHVLLLIGMKGDVSKRLSQGVKIATSDKMRLKKERTNEIIKRCIQRNHYLLMSFLHFFLISNLSSVFARFAETGEALVSSVDKMIFVGSPGVGRMVCCHSPKKKFFQFTLVSNREYSIPGPAVAHVHC